MKKVLLHICCGPCAIYPASLLRSEGFEVEGFFYNPNIHPFSEYRRRYEAVVAMSERTELGVIYHKYDFENFLKEASVLKTRDEQHRFCWRVRLDETAKAARERGIPCFTTTLLVSPYQDVAEISRLGDSAGASCGVEFLTRDFRKGFASSHQTSREWQLYHQNYCGCVYSEKESIEQRQARKQKNAKT